MEEKKMKKILTEIMMGILLSLLLIPSVQSIRLAVLEPTTITKTTDQTQSISSESDEKCATMTILGGLRENQKILTLETQSQLTAISPRPTDPYPDGDPFDGRQHLLPKLYNTTNFVFHWTNGTADGGNSTDVPLPKTDANGNGIPDVVENWGEIFEYVLDFLNNTRGFPAPPSDASVLNDECNRNPDGRYDVFLYEIPGYFGYAYPEQYPVSPSYSHIGLSNSLGTLAGSSCSRILPRRPICI
jgi:hypothetical protein